MREPHLIGLSSGLCGYCYRYSRSSIVCKFDAEKPIGTRGQGQKFRDNGFGLLHKARLETRPCLAMPLSLPLVPPFL